MMVLARAGLDDDEQRVLAAYWGVTREGNWEGRTVLHVEGSAPEQLVGRGRAALFDARQRRPRPARDEKQLAAWNGMALRALAHGALVLGDARYAAAAERLVAFIRAQLLRADGRLWRTARDGTAHTPGFSEDYANIADGLLAAHAALGRADDLVLAESVVRRMIADFWDVESGTLYDTSAEHEATFARPRSLIDSATPAANSVAADVLLRLALLTGEADDDRRARSILRAVAPALDRQPSMFGRMLAAVDRSLGHPADAVIAAEANDERARELREAVARPYAPDLVIASVAPGDATAEWSIFVGKAPVDGEATAFVCRGYACEEPTSDPARAAQQVQRMTVEG
jgi:uncharacterized protein YyaL (SSP411 family)